MAGPPDLERDEPTAPVRGPERRCPVCGLELTEGGCPRQLDAEMLAKRSAKQAVFAWLVALGGYLSLQYVFTGGYSGVLVVPAVMLVSGIAMLMALVSGLWAWRLHRSATVNRWSAVGLGLVAAYLALFIWLFRDGEASRCRDHRECAEGLHCMDPSKPDFPGFSFAGYSPRLGRCTTKADADRLCQATPSCASEGQCTVIRSTCEVGDDIDCQQSERCRERAHCTAVLTESARYCTVTSDQDCARSELCELHGGCSLSRAPPHRRGADCVPGRLAHCENSRACKTKGHCSVMGQDGHEFCAAR
jgi:hypothetical protein